MSKKHFLLILLKNMKYIWIILLTMTITSYAYSSEVYIKFKIIDMNDILCIRVIDSGEKNLSSDFIERKIRNPLATNEKCWDKSIKLNERFYIGATICKREILYGFGIWGKITGRETFSWKWLVIEDDNGIDCNGNKIVKIKIENTCSSQEISEIYFVTDTVIRICDMTIEETNQGYLDIITQHLIRNPKNIKKLSARDLREIIDINYILIIEKGSLIKF